jgi:chromosome segregation ATPase
VNDTDGKVRERLVRQFDILKNEIKTYENNLGFFTLSSKSGNGLVDELNRKVEKLKADLAEIKAKIAALDEKKQGN